MEDLNARVTKLVRGRRVIIVGGFAASATRRVEQLRSYGAQRLLVLARGVGTGPLPPPEDAEVVVAQLPAPTSVSEEVRGDQDLASDPPAELRRAVEAYDPDVDALCLLSPFTTVESFWGRQTLGGRRPEWAALEDKTRANALWDAVGVRRAPAEVVAATEPALRAAAARLDRGDGTVWSGDTAEGINGGADLVRWVRTSADAEDAAQDLAAHCKRVRVMPFLDGVPCSVHGFVLPDGVAVFRPVELVVLRRPGSVRFVYAGVSTWWDPPNDDREAMRAAARGVGAHLSAALGYRGGFGLDGVLTAKGWLPTEINPRFAAGLNTIARGVPELPLELLQQVTVRDLDPGVTAGELEATLLAAADDHRSGGAWLAAPGRPPVEGTGTDTRPLVCAGGRWRLGTAPEAPHASLSYGPGALGGFLRFEPTAAAMRPGQRMAHEAVQALALADRLWGTGLGPLAAAPEVR